MEPVSFAVGVIPLVGLFTTFFEIYGTIRTLKDMGDDFKQEQKRLQLESERVRYIKEKYDLGLFDEESKRLLDMVLNLLNAQMAEINNLVSRHSNEPRETTSAASGSTGGKRRWVLNRIRWAAGDKEDLDQAERTRNSFLLRTYALRTPDLAVTMDQDQYPGIAKAARVKQLLQASLNSSLLASHADAISRKIPVTSIQWHKQGGLSQAMDSPWATGLHGARNIVVEWRGPFMGGMALPAAAQRLNQLCELLRAMHEAKREQDMDRLLTDGAPYIDVNFAQLQCIGWTLASELSLTRIGLVFQYPPGQHEAPPTSLRDRISASRRLNVPVPPLDQRFALALGVTSAVANIISVGWAHRAVRSENMLSFGVGSDAMSKLYLVGFTYARPDDESSFEFSDLPQGRDWAFYRPPTITNAKSDIFDDDEGDNASILTTESLATVGSAAHDIYGLGIVLLEIGHWTIAQKMSKSKGIINDVRTFQQQELPVQVEKLAARCGTIYRDVVRQCLDPTNWRQEIVIDNLASILQSLRLCRA
ncbi:hypothetical protein TrVFT333_005472 [Trichoderma virens FT-333]|nr:hypothetical protein TrVFT333_005472 [Trichoderma virens FT-333]